MDSPAEQPAGDVFDHLTPDVSAGRWCVVLVLTGGEAGSRVMAVQDVPEPRCEDATTSDVRTQGRRVSGSKSLTLDTLVLPSLRTLEESHRALPDDAAGCNVASTWKVHDSSMRSFSDDPAAPPDDSLQELESLHQIGEWVRASSRLVAFTGAGISTESGIPDYRGPNGVWATRDIPHIDKIRTDPQARRAFWAERRLRYPEMLARQPNAGHEAIARLERSGKLLAVITQNIDGLHQKAGNSPERVIELHGSTHRIRCTVCGRMYAGAAIQARLDAGDDDPHCPVCGGALRSGTILFGEALPEEALKTAVALAKASDLMLVVGSSLVVNPAARLPLIAKRAGARLVILNRTRTPLDDEADSRLSAGAGPALTRIVDHALREDAHA